ncbi:MAG: hypothetical protein ABIJ74_01085 [archaeon]
MLSKLKKTLKKILKLKKQKKNKRKIKTVNKYLVEIGDFDDDAGNARSYKVKKGKVRVRGIKKASKGFTLTKFTPITNTAVIEISSWKHNMVSNHI